MKILISSDGFSAHYYIRLGLARAFQHLGHTSLMWDIHNTSAPDIFDGFQPDIFIGQTFNLNRPLIRAIRERPHLKVIMKAADWGPMENVIDKKEYPILFATNEEKANVLSLHKETGKPDYLYIHYHPDYIKETHGGWQDMGIRVESQLSAADTFEYSPVEPNQRLASDICFIGGYWPYKAKVLDAYLVELCKRSNNYNIKIFGNSHWPVSQYCGTIDGEHTKHVLSSTKIAVNLHEPHSQKYGFDVIERPFKLLSNGCFVISDYVEGLKKLIPDGIVYVKSPEEFFEKIDFYMNDGAARNIIRQTGYDEVMSKHTYVHRAKQILERLGIQE